MDSYNQFLTDYANVNRVIRIIDMLDYEIRSQPEVEMDRKRLIKLQSKLFQIYQICRSLGAYLNGVQDINFIVQSIENFYNKPINPVVPVVPNNTNGIEHSVWYETWTSWESPIPNYVNTINLFVGNINHSVPYLQTFYNQTLYKSILQNQSVSFLASF